MGWHTWFGEPRVDLTIITLPVGIGLLRLRWQWRRYSLFMVWTGYVIQLLFLIVIFARARRAGLLPGPGGASFVFFGWQPNVMQFTWRSMFFFIGETALLLWLHLLLLRPRVKALYEYQRGQGAGGLETLLAMAILGVTISWISEEVRIQGQGLTGAAAETWSPALIPGENPDFTKIRNEIRTLRDTAQYDEALGREIWCFNHALEYDRGMAGVRLSFALSDWVEFGRRYPKATQALIEIRDHDMQQFIEGTVLPGWFQEISGAIPGFFSGREAKPLPIVSGYLGYQRKFEMAFGIPGCEHCSGQNARYQRPKAGGVQWGTE